MPLPLPCTHLMIDDLEVELYRCHTDGGLVIFAKGYDSQALFKAHGKHELRQPVIIKDGEIEQILDELGINKSKEEFSDN